MKKIYRTHPKALPPTEREAIEVAIQTFWLCYEDGQTLDTDEVLGLTIYILKVLRGFWWNGQ